MQLERTRFLEDLDRMVMMDRRGAIDDMLQVLRELKIIQTAYSTASLDDRYRDREGFFESRKSYVADMISRFLLESDEIRFTTHENQPYQQELVGSVEIVVGKR